MMSHTCDGRYYAKDGRVWKAPLETVKHDGSRNLRMGFPVCRIEEYVSEDAGPLIAAALNHVYFGDPMPTEPSTGPARRAPASG